jgi:hypothetical protein
MKCVKLLIDHLTAIFVAIFTLETYSDSWKESITAVLCKPGKPCYDIAKAHHPIALLDTIAKVLTAVVTEDLSY